ncbi:MAG: hypothetical protein Nk1A_2430 [Endomicrobiia bacterium]|nr:MAG: hypothetical protein Nk1A_2430 [Endomicrobiia bacterium]
MPFVLAHRMDSNVAGKHTVLENGNLISDSSVIPSLLTVFDNPHAL